MKEMSNIIKEGQHNFFFKKKNFSEIYKKSKTDSESERGTKPLPHAHRLHMSSTVTPQS